MNLQTGAAHSRSILNPRPRVVRRVSLAAVLLFAPPPAWAHHATGGSTPETLYQGLLSGLAHPLIGPDHLLYLLILGALAGVARAQRWMMSSPGQVGGLRVGRPAGVAVLLAGVALLGLTLL